MSSGRLTVDQRRGSIVATLVDGDLDGRLEAIRRCPIQFQACAEVRFQAYVEGTDVRVPTIGAEVFATASTSPAAICA